MNKKRSRRQQIAIRSFTYGVMTLAALIGVVVCFAYAMGYRFNFKDGQFTQIALLQFNSFPGGATVDVNGEQLSTRTATRLNVKSGENQVNMFKDGYRTWRKTVTLKPSEVLWLDYARLIPNSITTDTIRNFTSVSEIAGSPDRNWLLIRTSDNARNLTGCAEGVACDASNPEYYNAPFVMELASVSDPNNVKFSEILIDASKVTAPTADQSEKFTIVEWDKGSRYILIKHAVGETTEYLVVDRQNPTVTKNLNKDFGMTVGDPHFFDNSGQVFFALVGTDIRKFDYGNSTVSSPLVTNVQSYRLDEKDSSFSYVTVKNENNQVVQNVGIYANGKATSIKTYNEKKSTLSLLANFDGKDYLAIARDGVMDIYPDPLRSNNDSYKETITLNSSNGINWLDSSPQDRFIIAGKGENIINYDLDTDSSYTLSVKDLSSAPQWLDEWHIVNTYDGIDFMEFDGKNLEDIVSGRSGVMLSANQKYLFSIGDISGGAILQRSKLVIN